MMRDSLIIQDFSEYSGISVDEILSKIENFQAINAENFKTHENPFSFYENSDSYIYDLFCGNSEEQKLLYKIESFSPGLLSQIKTMPLGSSFLEFGGGLGVFCELVKKMNPGVNVTYCDIKTKISDFTLWRYKKRSIEVNTLIIPQEDFAFDQKYDMIFSDAVIEHLEPTQQELYVKKLASYVNPGGSLVLLIDISGKTEEFPMHFEVDLHKLHLIVENAGYTCVYGKEHFSSRWSKDY